MDRQNWFTILKNHIASFTKSNKIANILIKDVRLRIVLMTLLGMGLNFIYAVFNGIVGLVNHSAWCGSLSAYYILLCTMRFLSVSYAGKIYSKKRKWRKLQSKDKRLIVEDIDLSSFDMREDFMTTVMDFDLRRAHSKWY